MGKNTRNFRQTERSRSGSQGAQNYSQVNRNPWHKRVLDFINIRGKGKGEKINGTY